MSDNPHPNIAGREAELLALTTAVRRLSVLTVINSASPKATADFAKQAQALADKMEKYVPSGDYDPNRHPPFAEKNPDGTPANIKHFFQYDGLSGQYNPVAVPMKMEWDAPIARGWVNFNELYVGPPGCVHGGFIVAYFDQIFTLANIMNGVTGPTVKLSINYRKPTPLNTDLRFEAELDYVSGSRIHTKGAVYYGDTMTAEATGLFIMLTRDQISKLSEKID